MHLFTIMHILLAIIVSLLAVTTSSPTSNALTAVGTLKSGGTTPTPTSMVYLNLEDMINANLEADALNNTTSLAHRDFPYANMVVTVWASSDCTGSSFQTAFVYYGHSQVVIPYFQSIMLARDLIPGEQLDFSGPVPNAPPSCEPFLFYTRAGMAGPNKGFTCYAMPGPGASCYKLWQS